MTHILDFVRDKPSLSLGDITSFYSHEYGPKISKHMSYAGKTLALTELYGDVVLSYNKLLWYMKELKRRDPVNCVDLQVNEESGKFERVFVAFESSINGFKYCRVMVYLDGSFLRSEYKGACWLLLPKMEIKEYSLLLLVLLILKMNPIGFGFSICLRRLLGMREGMVRCALLWRSVSIAG